VFEAGRRIVSLMDTASPKMDMLQRITTTFGISQSTAYRCAEMSRWCSVCPAALLDPDLSSLYRLILATKKAGSLLYIEFGKLSASEQAELQRNPLQEVTKMSAAVEIRPFQGLQPEDAGILSVGDEEEEEGRNFEATNPSLLFKTDATEEMLQEHFSSDHHDVGEQPEEEPAFQSDDRDLNTPGSGYDTDPSTAANQEEVASSTASLTAATAAMEVTDDDDNDDVGYLDIEVSFKGIYECDVQGNPVVDPNTKISVVECDLNPTDQPIADLIKKHDAHWTEDNCKIYVTYLPGEINKPPQPLAGPIEISWSEDVETFLAEVQDAAEGKTINHWSVAIYSKIGGNGEQEDTVWNDYVTIAASAWEADFDVSFADYEQMLQRVEASVAEQAMLEVVAELEAEHTAERQQMQQQIQKMQQQIQKMQQQPPQAPIGWEISLTRSIVPSRGNGTL